MGGVVGLITKVMNGAMDEVCDIDSLDSLFTLMLRTAEVDQNGTLSWEELETITRYVLELFSLVDLDGDDFLTRSEFIASPLLVFIGSLDSNEDNTLTWQETRELLNRLSGDMFNRLDANCTDSIECVDLANSGEVAASVQVTVDGYTYVATLMGTTWTALVTNALTTGTYNVQAQTTDRAGNVGNDTTTDELTISCEGEGEGEGETGCHTSDQDCDSLVNLSELLRVIQFFNSDGDHCQDGTEDGYNLGPGDRTCIPHQSDYNRQDWRVDLSELLRNIQFSNSGGYHYCPGEGTEDGFCPGP